MVGNVPGLLALSTPLKGAFEILLCSGAWPVLAANWDFASILSTTVEWDWGSRSGSFCLLEKCEESSGWGGTRLRLQESLLTPLFLSFSL